MVAETTNWAESCDSMLGTGPQNGWPESSLAINPLLVACVSVLFDDDDELMLNVLRCHETY